MRCDSSFPGQISEVVSAIPRGDAGYDGACVLPCLVCTSQPYTHWAN